MKFLTPTELADLLQVPVATIYGWNYRGSGPRLVRVGKHVRFLEEEERVIALSYSTCSVKFHNSFCYRFFGKLLCLLKYMF